MNTSKTKASTILPPSDYILNAVPSKKTELDWQLSDAIQAGAIAAAPPALPANVDLRQPWWKIVNQGQTGSCVGQAAASLMKYHLVQINKLPQNEEISARFIWMAAKEFDDQFLRPQSMIEQAGTSLKAAMDICRKYGSVSDALLPLNVNPLMYTGSENVFYATAAQRRITAYYNLQKSFNQWRVWLNNNGPILAGLRIDATWMQANTTNANLDTFQKTTAVGGHAVCIVGYTPGRFIIRNSWGTNWGDGGFAYASEAYITSAFFDESYGITL